MLAVYDFLAVSAGRPVRATMRRQQGIRNRNLRRLLNNLDEDRITIREFLISAGNQFEFDDNNVGNNAGEFEDYNIPMEEARAAFEVLLFVGVLPGEHDDEGENDDGVEAVENDPTANPADEVAAEDPVDAAAADNPVEAAAADNPHDAAAAVYEPAAAAVRGRGQRAERGQQAGRGGVGAGRGGVGAVHGDEELHRGGDLPPVRGQIAGRGQRAGRGGVGAGRGGVGAGRGGVGAGRGDEEPDQEDLPPVRGRGQRARRRQRAGRGGVGAGRGGVGAGRGGVGAVHGDEELHRGGDLPPVRGQIAGRGQRAGRGGVGAGRGGVGAVHGDEEPGRGEHLPAVRGQRAGRGQHAGRDGLGAGLGDEEPGRGEDLPPADNLVDIDWEIPDDPEWARRLQEMFDRQTAQHLRRRDEIMERLQQDRLRRQQEEEILFEEEVAMMEVPEEIPFLAYNPAAIREINPEVADGTCTVCLDNQADHSLRPCQHIFCLNCIDTLRVRICPLCRERIADVVPVDPQAVVAANALLAINQPPN